MIKLTESLVDTIRSYGIAVHVREARGPNDDLGRIVDFTIEVARDSLEDTILPFTLCHLFGHIVQFAISDRYKSINKAVAGTFPLHLGEDFWSQYYNYEREAFGYGASLLDKLLGPDDQLWGYYSAFMEIDFAHFRRYVLTGRQADRNQYRRAIQERYSAHLEEEQIWPIPIPALDLRQIRDVDAVIY